LAGLESVRAKTDARTRNVCAPRDRAVYPRGERHFLQAPPSRLQWNLDPGIDELNLKVARRDVVVDDGPSTIRVLGATPSL